MPIAMVYVFVIFGACYGAEANVEESVRRTATRVVSAPAPAQGKPTSSRPSQPKRDVRLMTVVVHRGANHLAPENTMASTRKAVELGADYVEVDVRTSADGVMYVLHDVTVNRTTDGEGLIKDLTSEQIDKLDAGSWFDPKFKGERVPRLRTLLEWIRGKCKVYFDVKAADIAKLIDLVDEMKMRDQVFFWFGNKLEAARFRRLDKELPLKINVKEVKELRFAKRWFRASIIETSLANATPALLAEAKKLGMRVMILYGGGEKEVFRKILASGAEMVNLDRLTVYLEVEREEARKRRGKETR